MNDERRIEHKSQSLETRMIETKKEQNSPATSGTSSLLNKTTKATGNFANTPPPLPQYAQPSQKIHNKSSSISSEQLISENGEMCNAQSIGTPHSRERLSVSDANNTLGTKRRIAKRRPAAPSRKRIAANDDAPSIGGLIYAINQKPSSKSFIYAGIASGVWAIVSITLSAALLFEDINSFYGLQSLITHPYFLSIIATISGPILLFWFLAFLMWRTEELHLRSTAMAEVAVRLAEPDQTAEHSVASLGQAVRRQVSFMNEAVTRALGRAGELETLVNNEVNVLEKSYEDNERKIRNLLMELSGERHALRKTGDGFKDTLIQISTDVPQLIEHMSKQQQKLENIIEHAEVKLTQLECTIGEQTGRLETALVNNTDKLSTVLQGYTSVIDDSIKEISSKLSLSVEQMEKQFEDSLGNSAEKIDQVLTNRTKTIQMVLEEYSRALDTTLANRTHMLDIQLVERTKLLDEAFNERLRLFDMALGKNTHTLTTALDKQIDDIDKNLVQRIDTFNTASQKITNQSDTLRSVSENLLEQLNNVSSSLENQSNAIIHTTHELKTINSFKDHVLTDRPKETNPMLRELNSEFSAVSQKVKGCLKTLSDQFSKTTEEVRQKAAIVAQKLDQEQIHLRQQLDKLSVVTQEDADTIRKALREQLKALDQLNDFAKRSVFQSEIATSKTSSRQLPSAKTYSQQARLASLNKSRPLTELTDTLAHEVNKRNNLHINSPESITKPLIYKHKDSNTNVNENKKLQSINLNSMSFNSDAVEHPKVQSSSYPNLRSTSSVKWSLNDLLSRVPEDEANLENDKIIARSSLNSSETLSETCISDHKLDTMEISSHIKALAHALNPSVASDIWSRFKNGQRGFMARSIYAPESRHLFDDIVCRYQGSQEFRSNVDGYLRKFEQILRTCDLNDPSGKLSQSHIVSEEGRAYLLLAHASQSLL